jgi:hypothetical protein
VQYADKPGLTAAAFDWRAARRVRAARARAAVPATFVAVTVLALLCYLPFLAIEYDLNGLREATAVEAGGAALFFPNHPLYRPIGALLYAAGRSLGLVERSLEVLQPLTAVSAALGIGFAFAAYRALCGSTALAACAAIWLGTSWAYWRFSADASYFPAAALPVAAALAWLATCRPSALAAAVLGMLCALGVLLLQSHVLLLPAFALGLLVEYRGLGRAERLKALLSFGLASLAASMAGYLAVGISLVGGSDVPSLLLRATGYGASLPLWGEWSLERVGWLPWSAISSVVPISTGLGIRGLLSGSVDPGRLPAQLVALLFPLLLGCVVLVGARAARTSTVVGARLGWLLAGYCAYLPFLAWWEPFDPVWFVSLNVFLGGAIVVALARGAPRMALPAFGVTTLLTAITVFGVTIWPRHADPGPGRARAACVASWMQPGDLFLATDWAWPGYLNYVHRREVVNLISVAAARNDARPLMSRVDEVVERRLKAGGSVFLMDFRSYPAEHLAWLAEQTGMTPVAFERYTRSTAFDCADASFEQIVGLRGAS